MEREAARYSLSAIDPETQLVRAIIEAPAGSPHKYKFDPKHGEFLLHKSLPAGAVFPFDFGFIPSTEAPDGDPLDVLVLLEHPSQLGTIVPSRLIGLIKAEQTDQDGKVERNDRLLAVLETRYNPPRFRSLDEAGEQLLAEIEHFFVGYNKMEGREFRCIGRGDAAEALRLVEKSSAAG